MTRPSDDIDGNQDDRLRRRLRKLPPVKAAPDFEARLARRLAGEEPAKERRGLREQVFPPRRVPAFAYPLVALVAVGIVSYFMFWRTGITPVTNDELAPTPQPRGQVNLPQTPVLKQGEPAGTGEEQPALTSGKKTVSGSRRQLPPPAPQASIEPKSEQLRRGDDGSETAREEEAPALSKDAVKKSVPQTRLQQSVSVGTQKGGARSAEQGRGLGIIPVPRSAQTTGEFQMQSKAAAVAPVRDSAAIRDSLRLDSLRRALQQQRRRKPGG